MYFKRVTNTMKKIPDREYWGLDVLRRPHERV